MNQKSNIHLLAHKLELWALIKFVFFLTIGIDIRFRKTLFHFISPFEDTLLPTSQPILAYPITVVLSVKNHKFLL